MSYNSGMRNAPKVYRRAKSRMLPQDHVLNNIIMLWLETNPDKDFVWLDMCCGDGNFLLTTKPIIGDELSKHVRYHGYELQASFVHSCNQLLKKLGIEGNAVIGELSETLSRFQANGINFSCVSLINALHEIPSTAIARLLTDMLRLCAPDGFLFLFDLARLDYKDPELGSMPWTREDMSKFTKALSQSLKLSAHPVVSVHEDKAWYFRINKAREPHLDALIDQERENIIAELNNAVQQSLEDRKARVGSELVDLGDRMYMEEAGQIASEKRVGNRASRYKLTGDLALQELIDINVRDYFAFDQGLQHLAELAGD